MCIVSVWQAAHDGLLLDYVMIDNRDEILGRATLPLALHRDPALLCARDAAFGGTWCGLSPETSRIAVLTNIDRHSIEEIATPVASSSSSCVTCSSGPAPQTGQEKAMHAGSEPVMFSRGLVTNLALLGGLDFDGAHGELNRHGRLAPFNLCVTELRFARPVSSFFSNYTHAAGSEESAESTGSRRSYDMLKFAREIKPTRITESSFGFSNHTFNTWDKVTHLNHRLAQFVETTVAEPSIITQLREAGQYLMSFGALQQVEYDQLPHVFQTLLTALAALLSDATPRLNAAGPLDHRPDHGLDHDQCHHHHHHHDASLLDVDRAQNLTPEEREIVEEKEARKSVFVNLMPFGVNYGTRTQTIAMRLRAPGNPDRAVVLYAARDVTLSATDPPQFSQFRVFLTPLAIVPTHPQQQI